MQSLGKRNSSTLDLSPDMSSFRHFGLKLAEPMSSSGKVLQTWRGRVQISILMEREKYVI